MILPRAILLDLDDTVYDYSTCHATGLATAQILGSLEHKGWQNTETFSQAYSKARSAIQSRLAGQAASHCRLLYFKGMVENQFGASRLNLIQALHDAYWKGYFAELKPDDGCLAALNGLSQQGVRFAWVTNFTTQCQMNKLEKLGLENIADFLVTSEEAGADKPSQKPFVLALEKLMVASADTCVIGDDWQNDLSPALTLGMRAVLRRRPGNKLPCSAPGFDSWSELNSILAPKIQNSTKIRRA